MSLGLFATLKESFGSTKYTLARNGRRIHWIVISLLCSSIPFGSMLVYGNILKTFRNEEAVLGSCVGDVEKSFIRGLLSFIIVLIYSFVTIIISLLLALTKIMALQIILGLLLVLLELLFIAPALINFVREDKFSAAFDLKKIVSMITTIGWLRYILAIVLIFAVLLIVSVISGICIGIVSAIFGLVGIIPILGWIIAVCGAIIVLILIGMMVSFLMLWECTYFSKLFPAN